MTQLVWGALGERFFEGGIDRAVLYPGTAPATVGVAWNGVTSVDEKSDGGDAEPRYIDGVKYQNDSAVEEFSASLSAYTYPDEFAACDGTASFGKGLFVDNQPRKPFGLSYRTRIGNDLQGIDLGYKLHIIYNVMAAPSSHSYSTFEKDVAPIELSWDLTTTPVLVSGKKANAHFIIDSRETDPYLLEALEELLYGTGASDAVLPTVNQLISLFENWITLLVVDHGDGTATISGPDPVVKFVNDTEFTISWHSANPVDANTYAISTS